MDVCCCVLSLIPHPYPLPRWEGIANLVRMNTPQTPLLGFGIVLAAFARVVRPVVSRDDGDPICLGLVHAALLPLWRRRNESCFLERFSRFRRVSALPVSDCAAQVGGGTNSAKGLNWHKMPDRMVLLFVAFQYNWNTGLESIHKLVWGHFFCLSYFLFCSLRFSRHAVQC